MGRNDGQEQDLISDDEIAGGDVGPHDYPGTRPPALDNVSMSTSLRQVQDATNPVYTSQLATLFIIINVTIGVGMLAMPVSMQKAGVVTSIIVQLFFLAVIVITCIMCIEMTVKSGVGSYHEIIERYCGRFAYQFTQTSILLICFGTVVAFIEVIGDQSDRFFKSYYNSDTFCHTWYLNRRFIMSLTTWVAIKPLCSARTVDFLKYVSFLGIISISVIFYVVAAKFVDVYPDLPKDIRYYPDSWADIPFILPVFCLSYQCHLSLVPTIATIHRRQKPKAFITLTIAMIIVMIVYSVFSVLAVLTFGGQIKEDVTENFDGRDGMTFTAIVIVAVKCVLTLPAGYLPARLSVIDILSSTFPRFDALSEPVKRMGVTVAFIDLSLLTALYVPNILVVVNMLGCIAVMLIFTLPGMAYSNLVKENRLEKQRAEGGERDIPFYTAKDKMKLITSYFMIVFGIIMTVIVLYESIVATMNSKSKPPLCV